MDNMADEAHKETRNANSSFFKRAMGSVSRWLKKPMIEINLDVSTPALPKPLEQEIARQAPEPVEQPKPAEPEQKPEPERPAQEPKPQEHVELDAKPAAQDEKPAVAEPAAEEKKEEEPKPAPVKAPAPKRRIAFKSTVPPSKISAWVHHLAPTRENQSIQTKIIDAGPACIEHLIRFIDDEKVYMSARQVAADMVIRVWTTYSSNGELGEDLAEFYLNSVLPSLKGISDPDLRKNLPGNMVSKIESRANEILRQKKEKEENAEVEIIGKEKETAQN